MRTIFATVALAAIALTSAASVASAKTYTYAQERRACRGDAIRLCWRYIPNRDRITVCMAAKHDQLSPKCRLVFDTAGPAR
jgi:hypothetical protein